MNSPSSLIKDNPVRRLCFSLTGIAPLLCITGMVLAATPPQSVKITLTAEITAGTCSTRLWGSTGADLTNGTLSFGDVRSNDVITGARSERVVVRFAHCSGVHAVNVTVKPGGGGECDGSAYTREGWGTEVQVWNGDSLSSALMISCVEQTKQNIEMTQLEGGSGELPLIVRLVARGSIPIYEGKFSVPLLFSVDYE